jgi:hypothetical protein
MKCSSICISVIQIISLAKLWIFMILPEITISWFKHWNKPSIHHECMCFSVSRVFNHFNHTFRYIDDVLSMNNHDFHNYVHLIYPNELEIKDTTESDKSASYLDILLNIDSSGRLTTSLYDKRDDFDFKIVNFRFLCSNIPLSSAYGVYVSQLIRYARACCVWGLFKTRQTTYK